MNGLVVLVEEEDEDGGGKWRNWVVGGEIEGEEEGRGCGGGEEGELGGGGGI